MDFFGKIVRGRYRKLTIIARPQRQPPISVAPAKDRFCYNRTKPRTFLDAFKSTKKSSKTHHFRDFEALNDGHVDLTNLKKKHFMKIERE